MTAPNTLIGLLLAIAVLGLASCGGKPDDGPIEVRWDRDACQRCRMVLSDRLHAAQIRYTIPGKKRTKVKLFDDIGCALLWLDEQDWGKQRKTAAQIWVNDWRNGDWIDARTATYIKGQVTPMEYGLGAQTDPDPEGIGFAQAHRHILDIEQRFNVHGAHLQQQADQRQTTQPRTPQ